MKKLAKMGRRYAVCVRNHGYEVSLERNKIYVLLRDSEAERDGDVRVVDESGEDYLYPADWFVPIRIPVFLLELNLSKNLSIFAGRIIPGVFV